MFSVHVALVLHFIAFLTLRVSVTLPCLLSFMLAKLHACLDDAIIV